MKKFLALLLALVMVFALVACGTQPAEDPKQPTEPDEETGGTIYVLGPTPDHGWTAQAGVYAEQTCAEITEAGTYKALYISASSGEEQVDQINTIIANGDAVGVVMMALEDSA